jgi:hypothetical protein
MATHKILQTGLKLQPHAPEKCVFCAAPIYKKKIEENKTWIFFKDVFAQKISDTIVATT